MLKTYFYIPADKPKFLAGLDKLSPDFFILDLEDSLTASSSEEGLRNLTELTEVKDNYWVRIGLSGDASKDLKTLVELGVRYKNIKLPKIGSSKQLSDILNDFGKRIDLEIYDFIISIESPEGVINLNEIFRDHSHRFSGVSIGTHDYCREMNAVHEPKYFDFMRNSILNYCKAYGKFCLDFASMNITDEELFKNECLEGFRSGFDGKPILHPWQLEKINEIQFYTESEIKDAVEVYRHFRGEIPKDVPAVKINSRIIEKPHLRRLEQIIKYLKKTKRELI
ncbi:MAG: hypothetical protein JXR90_07695 [Spirochaetes bacterium]|nr:hypothetical protein [Spirochaetota bacterium]